MALVTNPITTYLPGYRLIDGSQLDGNLQVGGAQSGITAVVGGTIVTAFQIGYQYTEVDVATATGTDAVKLPAAIPGTELTIVNKSGQTINVFPYKATDTINGGGAGAAITQVNNTVASYFCVIAGVWQRYPITIA